MRIVLLNETPHLTETTESDSDHCQNINQTPIFPRVEVYRIETKPWKVFLYYHITLKRPS